MRAFILLCLALLLATPALAAPACKGGAFGKTCTRCDTGVCLDAATKKIGACSAARCGEAAAPAKPKPPAPEPNTGY